MRNIILAGLALLSLGAQEARAAAPDTSRVHMPATPPREEPALVVGEPDLAGVALTLGSQERGYQDDYRQDYEERRSQYAPRVRVWLDNDRDLLRLGERTRVLVRTTEDAYLAVIHIDTNGDVEFLYPYSPRDDGYVRGGRTYSLPSRGAGYLSVRGGYGIGYVFAVASAEPLDIDRFRDSWYRSARWDPDRNVYGDPFFAMERFEHGLVRDPDYGYHDTDYYSYHVGRRYTYPRYACYDSYGPWYTSRAVYWDTCDRVRVLLVSRPYYYDTRYWRGDRGYYYRRYYRDYYQGRRYSDRRDRDPEHGYKDGGRSATTVPPLRRQGSTRDVSGQLRREDDRQEQEPRVRQPERTRPTFGRRSTAEPDEPPTRDATPRRDEPRYIPRRGSEPTERRSSPPAERRSEPPARRSDPPAERRSSPPPERRAEPRRESPPPRSAEPRESPPPRSSAPPRSSGGRGRP